jgi:hypothetical protein
MTDLNMYIEKLPFEPGDTVLTINWLKFELPMSTYAYELSLVSCCFSGHYFQCLQEEASASENEGFVFVGFLCDTLKRHDFRTGWKGYGLICIGRR